MQGKRRPVHDKHACDCGAATENTAHVFLRCPLYSQFRAPFALLLDRFLALANRTQGEAGLPGLAGRGGALHWIHHDQPLLVDPWAQMQGQQLRAAALAMYSQIQHARRVAGHSTEMPPVPLPEYLIEPEDAQLLVPFTNPGANCVNHNTT